MAAKRTRRELMGNPNLLFRHMLTFCDENVQDIPEGRLLVMVLAQAFSDMACGDWLARRWIRTDDCRGLCAGLGLSYHSVLSWAEKYDGEQARTA